MKKRIKKRIVLITGASGGFGQDISIAFAKKNFKVILVYKSNTKEIINLKKKLDKIHTDYKIFKSDITKSYERKKIINYLKNNNGIDILVNNAGINKVSDFEKIAENDWDKIMNVNLKSAFFMTQGIFGIMKKQRRGRIINISSGAALYHGPKTAHYAISKAGLISMTKLIARFGAPFNIMCNAIAPGIIKTNMTKKEVKSKGGKNYIEMTLLKRFGKITDVVSAVMFLSSEKQNYITGDVINLTGGASLG